MSSRLGEQFLEVVETGRIREFKCEKQEKSIDMVSQKLYILRLACVRHFGDDNTDT